MPTREPGRSRRSVERRAEPAVVFRTVDGGRWPDFESFFESPGAPKYCWCMVWRRNAEEAKRHEGRDRKRQMKKRIGSGVPVGLLAYSGKEPVAWVSVAPRETYRNLGGPAAGEGESIWSIACFYVPRRLRGQGGVVGSGRDRDAGLGQRPSQPGVLALQRPDDDGHA